MTERSVRLVDESGQVKSRQELAAEQARRLWDRVVHDELSADRNILNKIHDFKEVAATQPLTRQDLAAEKAHYLWGRVMKHELSADRKTLDLIHTFKDIAEGKQDTEWPNDGHPAPVPTAPETIYGLGVDGNVPAITDAERHIKAEREAVDVLAHTKGAATRDQLATIFRRQGLLNGTKIGERRIAAK